MQAFRTEQEPISAVGDIKRLVTVSAIGAVTGFAMLWVGFVIAAIPGFFAFCYAHRLPAPDQTTSFSASPHRWPSGRSSHSASSFCCRALPGSGRL